MSMRKWLGALAAAAVLVVGVAAPATAAVLPDRTVELEMTWSEIGIEHDVDVALFGGDTVTIVPGDTGRVLLRVHNLGPTDGYLSAYIVDKDLFQADDGDYVANYLRINGVRAADLADNDTVVHHVLVPRGGTADLEFWYELPPYDVGNAALVGEQEASFSVLLRKTGTELPGTDQPGADQPGTDRPELPLPDTGRPPANDPGINRLPVTGGELTALIAVAALLGAGLFAVVAGKRRRRDDRAQGVTSAL